jgi:hypothetical protein
VGRDETEIDGPSRQGGRPPPASEITLL